MGAHAFSEPPEHCQVYQRNTPDNLPRLVGVAERWNMPTSRHRADLGAQAHFEGVGHYVLTFHIGGEAARRLDGIDRDRVARRGAISLQAPGNGGVFASDGPVDYAHFYFQQSLLCELGDSLSLGSLSELGDFFARYDVASAADLEAYVFRAMDMFDPPTAIEMDSRAYLIGLDILRAVTRSRLHDGRLARADMTRALEVIEERIGEPLRLTDLAAILDLSPFHFSRVFREHTGETPAAYLMRRRAERARELVTGTNLPLAEIAFRVGFSSQSHMTRRLKDQFGVTPGALRRNR